MDTLSGTWWTDILNGQSTRTEQAMPFKESSIMEVRQEFINLAIHEESNIRGLCKRFGISPTTGYKWIRRFESDGIDGLTDRSRKPRSSPWRTSGEVEQLVLSVRDEHPKWGPQKIKRRLLDKGHSDLPAVSTIGAILKRNGRVDEVESGKHKACKRFEREAPNESWQMDFKGHFQIGQGRCHPLTVLDDHSRYLVGLEACGNEHRITVQECLIRIFRQFGLPDMIFTDNGPPWGFSGSRETYTVLGIWLIRLGIRLGRIGEYHPQTNGKAERLHRTLKAELLQGRNFKDLDECQDEFNKWRHEYNFERPHGALGMDVPAKRYRMSERNYPEKFPDPEYGPDDEVRRVHEGGRLRFHNKEFRVGRAFHGLYVAVRSTTEDGIYRVVCARQTVALIDERSYVPPPGGEHNPP